MFAYIAGLAGNWLIGVLAWRLLGLVLVPSDQPGFLPLIDVWLDSIFYLFGWVVLSTPGLAAALLLSAALVILGWLVTPILVFAAAYTPPGEPPIFAPAALLGPALVVAVGDRLRQLAGRRSIWLWIHLTVALAAGLTFAVGLLAEERDQEHAATVLPAILGAGLGLHAVLTWRQRVRDGTATTSWWRALLLVLGAWLLPLPALLRDVPPAVAAEWPLRMREVSALARTAHWPGCVPGSARDWVGQPLCPLRPGEVATVRLGRQQISRRSPEAWVAVVDRAPFSPPSVADRLWLWPRRGGGVLHEVSVGNLPREAYSLYPPEAASWAALFGFRGRAACWRMPEGAWLCWRAQPRPPPGFPLQPPSTAPDAQPWIGGDRGLFEVALLLAPGLQASCSGSRRCVVEAVLEGGATVQAVVPVSRVSTWTVLRDDLGRLLRDATGLELLLESTFFQPRGQALPSVQPGPPG